MLRNSDCSSHINNFLSHPTRHCPETQRHTKNTQNTHTQQMYLISPLPILAPHDPGANLHHGGQLWAGHGQGRGGGLLTRLLQHRGRATVGSRTQLLLGTVRAGACMGEERQQQIPSSDTPQHGPTLELDGGSKVS